VGPLAQLWHVFAVGPLAPLRLRARSAAWLLVYLALCIAILGGAGWLVVAHRDELLSAAVRYVFPESWRFSGQKLFERVLASQGRAVLINAQVSASLALVGALLFPIKERVSRALEVDARLSSEPERPLPVARQVAEEIALLLVFVTAQMTIFWLGYAPEPWRRRAAELASWAVLFCQFSFNFVSPLLQRHGLRYATIAKLLFARPVVLVGFGALFTVPPVWLAHVARAHAEWSFARAVVVLEAVNIACIAWGTLAGAYVASRMLPAALAARLPSWPRRALASLAVLALFAANAYVFGVVGLALQRKSQLLKCKYSVDLTSIHVDLPDWKSLLTTDPVQLGVKLDLTVENPTAYDVAIEKNRLTVEYQDVSFANASLSPLYVAAGGTQRAHVQFPITVHTSILQRGRELFDWHRWRVTLFLEVAPGLDFPVYLLSP
jgi:Late embryogenesis abundant protein